MVAAERRIPGSPFPVVWLHGLGSSEEELYYLGGLAPLCTLTAIRAPLAYPPGYSWFGIDWDESGLSPDEAQAERSLAALVADLEAIAAEQGKIALCGFSQGAMMTLGVLMRRPDLLRTAIALSGGPLGTFFRQPPTPETLSVPVLLAHGENDEVVPFAWGERAFRVLQAGSRCERVAHRDGHSVSAATLADMNAWLGF